ncbi:MAG: hypothetical protein U0931_39620 [Vulcanimicrobiota bacterium]
MKRGFFLLTTALCCTSVASAVPLGPELVINGDFEAPRNVGWIDVGWGLDAPPHTGTRGAYTVYPVLGPAYWEQTLTGLTPGASYLVSFWVGNSPAFVPNTNGIEFDFGSEVYSAFQLGDDYQELGFTHVAASSSETIHITGFNYETAIFLDDVSVRQVLPDGAPELDGTAIPQGLLLIGWLLLASRRRSRLAP